MPLNWSFIISVVIGQASNTTFSSFLTFQIEHSHWTLLQYYIFGTSDMQAKSMLNKEYIVLQQQIQYLSRLTHYLQLFIRTGLIFILLCCTNFIAETALFWAGLKVKIFPSSSLKFKTGKSSFFLKKNQLKKMQARHKIRYTNNNVTIYFT
jgi:hypothetical protein